MTRKIKFRVWDKHDKKYLTDNLLMLDQRGNLYESDYFLYGKNTIDLEMFTGAKDKNGKDIYEGDLLKTIDGSVQPVIYDHGVYEDIAYYDSKYFTVVGNIHENPELLGEN